MKLNATFSVKLWEVLTLAAVMFIAGVVFGHWNWAPRKVNEPAAVSVILPPMKNSPNGAIIAARVDDPSAKPKQSVPNGFKVERVISAVVTPTQRKLATDAKDAPCPEVHIDATVVRDRGGAGRVLISSPDGITSDATDTVAQSISVTVTHPWAAGISYGTDKTYGGWVDRDIGRMRLGVDLLQMQNGSFGARARIGFSFGG